MAALTPRQRDMLFRVALAEKHTSPVIGMALTVEQRARVIVALKKRGLVVWDNGTRLTDKGREVLRVFCGHVGDWPKTGPCLACGATS